MYCYNCGQKIDDTATVCPFCGTATTNFAKNNNVANHQTTTPAPYQANTMAIVGFILSFFVAIVGLVCSIIGYNQAKDLNGEGKGFALAGIIISSISIAVAIIAVIAIIIIVSSVIVMF